MAQPTLPAEVLLTDIERDFIETSPVGLWPDNQNSNFGQLRKIICDLLQENADLISTFLQESFVQTSNNDLDMWEEQQGLPINPVGVSTETRRSRILGNIYKQPFTRTIRKIIVELYITATFGESIQLTSSGVKLSAGGVPLFAEPATDLSAIYSIVEDVINFAYTVTIDVSVTPDINGLTRDLKRLTPAGISFTIVN